MIKLENITKTFGDKKALDDVSFSIKTGEIVGLLGPNGAGKTTTMRLIVGYLKPTSGQVSVFEKNPIDERIDTLKNIGYLPENNPLYSEMKVKEYLDFIREIKKDTKENLNIIIEETAVANVMSSKIEELSRGYKQRVGLAAALLGKPKILILDEPTSGLDPLEQVKISNLIKSFAKKRTVILSTHILSEIEEVASRLLIINGGKLVYDGVKPKRKGDVDKLFRKLVK
jgi:ABC-2 type transport system ATP-binding protein